MSVPSYVDMSRLCQELCLCESTVEAWMKAGKIPPPKINDGKRLWKWIEVEQAIDGWNDRVQQSGSLAERIRDATRAATE
jgi:predicted site-specific integrase-resolvase